MLSRWLGLSALVIVLDQLSKAWITSHFVFGESLRIFGVFDLVLAHNTGAAFSFLHDAGGMQRWLFSAIAIVTSVWIVWLLRRHGAQTLFALALSLILGGALGNLICTLSRPAYSASTLPIFDSDTQYDTWFVSSVAGTTAGVCPALVGADQNFVGG